jgi:hypothetical protein
MLYKSLFIILFFSTQLLYFNSAFSEIYKWVDADGKVVYGDKPATVHAEKIKIKKSPTRDSNYQELNKKQQKLLDVMQEERDEKITLKKEARQKEEKQKSQCSKMKKELQKRKDASFLYKKDDDLDNPEIISDEDRKIEEAKYEDYIKKNC